MDADKVDSVLKWKVPMNHDLLWGFISSVGYLADDIPNVRIPMGILRAVTGDAVPFCWGYTEHRAFDDIKSLVHSAREHHRMPLDYLKGAPQIWVVTDGCATRISGLIRGQLENSKDRHLLFSQAKFSSTELSSS